MTSRRTFMFGALAVTGDGLVRPLGAPPGGALSLGVQPGTSSPVVIASTVIVFGPAGAVVGIFVYPLGTKPATGNPPSDWMSRSATDPYGNALPSGGTGSRNTVSGAFIALNTGGLVFAANTSQVTGSLQAHVSGAGASVLIASPTAGGADTPGELGLYSSASGTFGEPYGVMTGALYGQTPGAPQTPDPWHAMTLQNGWANNASFAVAQYRNVSSPPNSTEIVGAIAGNAATGNQFATLPAGYQPANPQGMAVGCTSSADSLNLRCDAAGNLTIGNLVTPAAQTFFFHGTISRDA